MQADIVLRARSRESHAALAHLTLDPATSAQLSKVDCPLVFCDPSGKVLGRFVPIPPDMRQPQLSEEELQRRESSGGGRSLTSILADLEARQ
jgi:hypothetical protein